MQSLRTRRSVAPPAKVQRSISKLAKPISRGSSKNGSSKSSRVDDKIKKRLSMRYADISGPTGLEIPDVPALPSGSSAMGGSMAGVGLIPAGPGARGRLQGGEQDERVRKSRAGADIARMEEELYEEDKRVLESETFDPDSYLKNKLGTSTEAELKSLQSSLRSTNEDTAAELVQTVFKNYAEFVVISKEVSTLENEMLELKELLFDWKSMPSLLHIDDSASLADRKRAARSSVADLRVLYASQMQTLHAQIEGSAKFAPTISGRHIVAEVPDISSLNPATFKVDHTVKFIVLDDLVLVARKKRRGGGGGESKLIAERCWPLNDMLVLDTKDTPSMTNVFKIRAGKETHVYRTDISTEKKNLLSLFRQVAEELSAKRRKEREGEHERRKTMMFNGASGRTSYAGDDWMADLALQAGVTADGGANEKAERDIRFVGEWSDELTVAIALKEWDKAVNLVEEGQEKLSLIPSLSTKMPALTASLIQALLSALSQPTQRKSSTVMLTGYLTRLGAGAAARQTFLEMRAKVMRGLVRRIRFEGHVGAYIGDLAVVWFTGLKHSADWFLSGFKENEVASSFIDWAKGMIEEYADIFRMQVYTPDVDPKVVEDALKITYMQSRKLLQEYGLDFRFMLDGLLVENPKPRLRPEASTSTVNIPSTSQLQIMASSGSKGSLSPSSTPTKKQRARVPSPIGSSSSPLSVQVPPVPALPSASFRQRNPSNASGSSSIASPSLMFPARPPSSSSAYAAITTPTPTSNGFNTNRDSLNNDAYDYNGSIPAVGVSSPTPTKLSASSSFGSQSSSSGYYPRPPRTPPPNRVTSGSGSAYGGLASTSVPSLPSSPSISKGVTAPLNIGRARSGSIGQQQNGRTTPSGYVERDRERVDSTGSGSTGSVANGRTTPVNGRTTPVNGGAAGPPPPRALSRPGSQANHRLPAVAVAKRQGMF